MDTFHNIGTSTDWIVMVVYFMAIMLFGSYFGRYTRNTADFFFGGRRFAWWLIAMSIVATGVGSHSFVKYSAKAFEHGFSSSMTYINDWFFVPFFLFGWLPIIVYTKVRSIPEYFEKRFSPSARFLATILLMLYMIGYIGIGFLTLGKAVLPMLPEAMTMLGTSFDITLMRAIIVIAIITGIYITFGGQTAVIFTDLLQGFILIFAGLFLFALGIDYLGGFNIFWNLLPVEWKLPLAHYNSPSSFNFVGIFWQDGVAGSIGFLFMNQGLIMRFMATRSVNEGRKAAAVNILFMLPISAIVVGNAGWIGKAIAVADPSVVSPNTSPDQIFVVVASIVAMPGVFGFIMAALTAALMSTVDTLINATAAIFINDVYRPTKQFLQRKQKVKTVNEKKELFAARIASIVITATGVLAVLAFKNFPTVYEAHGFFHSTLTPPLVVAIFLGVFWKKFTPAAVMATFIGGVALMMLGARYPGVLIAPFDHGIVMNPDHPYSYIRALYNMLMCFGVGVLVTFTTQIQKNVVASFKKIGNHRQIGYGIIGLNVVLFVMIALNTGSFSFLMSAAIFIVLTVPVMVTYFGHYDEAYHTVGLTSWTMETARERFKGSKVNDREGEIVDLNWKIADGDGDIVRLSENDMKRMNANIGDLLYLCDKRKWLGGLKSIHVVFGTPHAEDGTIYITDEQQKGGMFVTGRLLTAEKEM
ncbi:MAG: sodium:solute symporter family protein [Candidatus Marinimicrobia bacterium]|nr:sodium:solute symporter family protein [Candidatus Neomarinimicrobiota bacterium]